MCRFVALVAVLAAGWLVAPASAAVQLRRCGGAECGTVTRPLDPAAAARTQDRHRLPAVPRRGQGPAGRRSSPSRAGPGTRRPGAAWSTAGSSGRCWNPRPAAGRQPRDGRVGADRLPVRAVVHGAYVGRRRSRGGRRGARPRSTRRLRRSEPVRHRVRRRRPRRRDRGARLQARGPVRRLLRHVLRAGLRRAPPVRAALGDAGLRVSAAGHRPVVRVVGGDGARSALEIVSPGADARLGALLAARPRATDQRLRRTPTAPGCGSAWTRARCRTSSRTPRATR